MSLFFLYSNGPFAAEWLAASQTVELSRSSASAEVEELKAFVLSFDVLFGDAQLR